LTEEQAKNDGKIENQCWQAIGWLALEISYTNDISSSAGSCVTIML